jgi:hypothetical protein
MKMTRKSGMGKMAVVVVMLASLALPSLGRAGTLDPSAAPAPTMRTLQEIYDLVADLGRFPVVLGGTAVFDRTTGLVWERGPTGPGMTWDAAVAYCPTLTVGGKHDWRLPTIDELKTLVDATQSNPALPLGNHFVGVQSQYCWSSTTVAGLPGDAWIVDFDYGNVGGFNKDYVMYVRCVRGGQ